MNSTFLGRGIRLRTCHLADLDRLCADVRCVVKSNVIGIITARVTIPQDQQASRSTITGSLLSLIEVYFSPVLMTYDVNVTVGGETSSTYVVSRIEYDE